MSKVIPFKALEQGPSAFHILRVVIDGRDYTGLVCGASADEYSRGSIGGGGQFAEVHVQDLVRRVREQRAYDEPAMLTFPRSDALSYLMDEMEVRDEPLTDTVDGDGVRRMIWRVCNTVPMQKAFDGVGALTVVGDAHVVEAARRIRDLMMKENPEHTGLEAYNFFPAVLFPEDAVPPKVESGLFIYAF